MIRSLFLCFAFLSFVACDSAEEPKPGVASGSAIAAPVTVPIDAGASADASSAKEPGVFAVGDLVSAKWDDGYWYPGKIAAVNADGTYKIKYNDGDVSPKQKAKHIKHRKPSTGGGSSAGCGSGKMKCGGRCVDYLNDPKNCNACGRQCPEACMGGSCVSNAYKYGP